MFILRSADLNDLDDLLELSQLMVFINLPSDRDLLKKKIQSSLDSFGKPSSDLSKNHYIFVLEDLDSKKVIGASMIHAKHGTEEEPHFFLKVSREHKYSHSLNMGFIHGTLKLGVETNGWTEIGGLVLNPSYRGNKLKLGKQLSFVRFLFMGIHQNLFTKIVHSELMPPFDSHGNSPLWEAIGRRFMNMDYHEADLLSRKNKEFILSLFPSDTIYETLLPLDARDAIGKVGQSTKPVKAMLEKIGFQYTEEVDPFDGGPHFRAKVSELSPIKNIFHGQIKTNYKEENAHNYLLQISNNTEPFRATMVSANIDSENNLNIDRDTFNLLNLNIIEEYTAIIL